MEFFTYTLPNGIRCIHKRVRSSVVHCALSINTGSRDEEKNEAGMAHLVEHMLFKGTERRRAYHVNCRLENLGGELNAFTTKEETVIHATTLRSDFSKAAELIADVVFHSTFPEHELEKEKQVIFDEINLYKDSPSERIYDDFEELAFSDSPIGRNILGCKASLKKMGQADMVRFIGRTHNTDQMVFSVIGNVSEKTFMQIVERYFGEIPENRRAFERVRPGVLEPFRKQVSRGTHQNHCIIGTRAYDLYDIRRPALLLLSNYLGGPSANSLLNVELRERNALSYSVESSYTPFTDTGIAAIYFSCERDKTDRCLDIVEQQLNKIRTTPLTPRSLSIAKKQFIGQMAISTESNEAYMLAAAKSYLIYGKVDSMAEITARIKAIGSEEIMEAAKDIYGNMSMLIYK